MHSEGRLVVVFGGTGFLGRRVVDHLRKRGFKVRIASRHGGPRDAAVEPVVADIEDERSIANAVSGAYGVVNAVSLYVERGPHTFHSVHVTAAETVARQAALSGAKRLIHISGLGANAQSSSLYIRKRGEGELAVKAGFAGTTFVRPAVMFGPDDAFLTRIIAIMSKSPVYPSFGTGGTRIQPVFVDDIGDAAARLMEGRDTEGTTFECGGPHVYTYRELIHVLSNSLRMQRRGIPVPFAVWRAIAAIAEILPQPPLTRNQVELMEIDNVVSGRHPGLTELGVTPRPIEEILPLLTGHDRRY